ncbi:ATP-binding protein [Streptomyces sp. DT2A-34]|uniref:ATP-binding protein n=1 Tax=Streptomyces sp. DT2A-34 TaxID=3051182 RepID=UPI00265B9AA5|nr:ATP-binding protein [Streptomyces sp. DT2A-34]MDO0912360.1 ATP-binding protein [Streptomyces sp. DT2A-34]
MTRPLVLELLALPKAVPEARRAVREHLNRPCPEIQLCVSELLTNVITHVGEGTPVTLRLTHGHDGCARVEVTDPDAHTWLIARRPDAGEEMGRGLLLITAVARRWGVDRHPRGKTVWCEVGGAAADPETLEVPRAPRRPHSDICVARSDLFTTTNGEGTP